MFGLCYIWVLKSLSLAFLIAVVEKEADVANPIVWFLNCENRRKDSRRIVDERSRMME